MAGWHHWLDGCESEWTPGVGDGQGGLACCDSWGLRVGHDWATELNWTELSDRAPTISRALWNTWILLSSEASFSGALMSSDLCELHPPFFLYPQKTAQRHWDGGSFSNESDTDFRTFSVYLFSPPNKFTRCILLQFLHNRRGTEFLRSKTKGQGYEKEI